MSNRGTSFRILLFISSTLLAAGCNFEKVPASGGTQALNAREAARITATVAPSPSPSAKPSPSLSPAPSVGSAAAFSVADSSVGNGSSILRITEVVKGAGGAGLLACTNPLSNYATACLRPADFVLLRNQAGWSYDSAGDTYSIDLDVAASGYPDTTYFTKYILPNGSTQEVSFKALSINDNSYGNGTSVTHISQTVKGVGSGGLRACTAAAPAICSNFVYLANQDGWHYDQATDTYSFNADVSYPFQNYLTQYVLPDGRKFQFLFVPKLNAGYRWVYTHPTACVGPTPPPAPIGTACAHPGQTATNECGTATCQ